MVLKCLSQRTVTINLYSVPTQTPYSMHRSNKPLICSLYGLRQKSISPLPTISPLACQSLDHPFVSLTFWQQNGTQTIKNPTASRCKLSAMRLAINLLHMTPQSQLNPFWHKYKCWMRGWKLGNRTDYKL